MEMSYGQSGADGVRSVRTAARRLHPGTCKLLWTGRKFPVPHGAGDLREDRAADRDDASVTLEDISAPGEERRGGLMSGEDPA